MCLIDNIILIVSPYIQMFGLSRYILIIENISYYWFERFSYAKIIKKKKLQIQTKQKNYVFVAVVVIMYSPAVTIPNKQPG